MKNNELTEITGIEYTPKLLQHTLRTINQGEGAIVLCMKQIREIQKELDKTRLDFVSIRKEIFGKGHGRTAEVIEK